MALPYKLIQKRNPQDPEGPRKWYATPKSASPQSEKDMVKDATEFTTLSAAEFRAALEHLAMYVPRMLRSGHTVKVPGLGTFRITFKSQGTDTVYMFNPQEMIYDLRIVFIPDADFRERVLLNFELEDGGVRENGIDYASREAYKKAKEAAEPGA